MDSEIKIIEDLSLNAWPSHQMQVYDGWILRFSYFYTHRTNSVEQIGQSRLPLQEKIDYCEHIYKRWGTPCIFKITPLVQPENLDHILEDYGYHTEHQTDVMSRTLEAPITQPTNISYRVLVEPYISHSWIEGLFQLKELTNPTHREIVPSMYAAIPKDVIAVSIWDGPSIIATGLGILDRDYLGIYAIHVDASYRRQHLGSHLIEQLLYQGAQKGAKKVYLQVVHQNDAAKTLYTNQGFHDLYDYWFRVKNI